MSSGKVGLPLLISVKCCSQGQGQDYISAALNFIASSSQLSSICFD